MTYAIARSGGAASMVVYVAVTVLTALTSENQHAEAAPGVAAVEELVLEEVVAPPPVAAENPGVCT